MKLGISTKMPLIYFILASLLFTSKKDSNTKKFVVSVGKNCCFMLGKIVNLEFEMKLLLCYRNQFAPHPLEFSYPEVVYFLLLKMSFLF